MSVPDWAAWPKDAPDYSVGAEEELMLLDPSDWTLAHEIDSVLEALEPELTGHVGAETHRSVLELRSGVHPDVPSLAAELLALRRTLADRLEPLGLAAAAAGTHPFAEWHEIEVSTGARQQDVYDAMRELARREPTFALHVHVGVSSPERAIDLYNRLRGHVPLLLALSVNSPLWQGRDSGLGSARTPLFQAFPRAGIPRAFATYSDWAEAVDLLMRSGAIDGPTFVWWDLRPQPGLGTVEVRVPDVQSAVWEATALVALVQCVARLELTERYAPDALLERPEVLAENRFLAARDGARAELIDPIAERLVPVSALLEDLLAACLPHARELGCERELCMVPALAERSGADRQRAAVERGLHEVVAELAALFPNGP